MRRLLLALLCAPCLFACSSGESALEIPAPEAWDGFEPLVRETIEQALAEVREFDDSAAAWGRLAMTYHANNVIDLAGPCYERALELNDQDALKWYLLGRVQAEVGDLEAGLAALERARELKSDVDFVHWRRGTWLIDLGRLPEAQAAFQRALELEPRGYAARVGLARIAQLEGRPHETVTLLSPLVADDPQLPNRAYVQDLLGRALREVGREEEAQVLLASEATASLNWPDAWTERMFEQRVVSDWLIQRAHALVVGRDPKRALALVEPLREHHADDPVLNKMLGMAYFSLGEREEATRMLERVIAARPDDFSAYLNLGFVYEQSQAFEDAERFSQRAVELNPESVEARMQLARCLVGLERYAAARTWIEAVVDERPDWSLGWERLAQVRCELRDPEGASEALARAQELGANPAVLADLQARIEALRAQ